MKNQLNTQKECLAYFERLRWGKKVTCPYCLSTKTHRSKSKYGRHFCYNCVKSFSVTVGTIFEDTRLSLPVWISIIKTMLKSKNIITAQSLSDKFGITLKTAWLTSMKIRCGMLDERSRLAGLLPVDYSFIYSKRKSKKLHKYFVTETAKKAGAKKLTPDIFTNEPDDLNSLKLIGILKSYINHDKSTSVQVERSYAGMDKAIEQISRKYAELIKLSKQKSLKENYWAFIKNGIRQENKSLSPKYLPFYLLEYEYKFKRREDKNRFNNFMKHIFSGEYKADNVEDISKKQLAYA